MSRQSNPNQLDMFDASAIAPAAQAAPSSSCPQDPAPASLPQPALAEACALVAGQPAPRPAVARPGPKGRPQQGRQMRRTRVATAKTTVMSPEARRAAEERSQKMIEEYIAQGKVTKCPARWAVGSIPMSMFGTEG